MTNIQVVDMEELNKSFTEEIRKLYPDRLKEGEYYKAGYDIGIIQNGGRFICTDTEGVHYMDKVRLEFYKQGDGFITIIPDFSATYNVAELTYKGEIPIAKFIRIFGHRQEDNYAVLLKSMREIGLDTTKDRRARDAETAGKPIV